MIPLAIDSLGPWGFVLLAIYLIAALVYLAFFYGAGNATREQRAERQELDGPITSIGDFAAERKARADRATLAQRKRWGDAA